MAEETRIEALVAQLTKLIDKPFIDEFGKALDEKRAMGNCSEILEKLEADERIMTGLLGVMVGYQKVGLLKQLATHISKFTNKHKTELLSGVTQLPGVSTPDELGSEAADAFDRHFKSDIPLGLPTLLAMLKPMLDIYKPLLAAMHDNPSTIKTDDEVKLASMICASVVALEKGNLDDLYHHLSAFARAANAEIILNKDIKLPANSGKRFKHTIDTLTPLAEHYASMMVVHADELMENRSEAMVATLLCTIVTAYRCGNLEQLIDALKPFLQDRVDEICKDEDQAGDEEGEAA